MCSLKPEFSKKFKIAKNIEKYRISDRGFGLEKYQKILDNALPYSAWLMLLPLGEKIQFELILKTISERRTSFKTLRPK